MKIASMQVDLIHHVGSDLTVVNAARVSFNKTSEELTDKDTGLINYLAKHDHHSPFNHSFLTFRVKAPIFVARQLVKHKFMPWNEISRRYVDDEPEFYFPSDYRARAENVKQGSLNSKIISHIKWKLSPVDEADHVTDIHPDVKSSIASSLALYRTLLRSDVCPEQARMVLPQNTMTEWYWSGTLGAFMDMLKLRLDSHTQQETREVAQKIAEHVKQLFPISYGAYIDNV